MHIKLFNIFSLLTAHTPLFSKQATKLGEYNVVDMLCVEKAGGGGGGGGAKIRRFFLCVFFSQMKYFLLYCTRLFPLMYVTHNVLLNIHGYPLSRPTQATDFSLYDMMKKRRFDDQTHSERYLCRYNK